MTKEAYMVVGIDVTNDTHMTAYRKGVVPLLKRYGGEIIADTTDIEVIDGKWARKGVMVLRFESVKHANAFMAAPEYMPLRLVREDSSERDVILVEGMQEKGEGTPNGKDAVFLVGTSDVTNPAPMAEYAEKVPPVAAKYGLEALAASTDFELLGGEWPRQQVVLLKFPSEEKFKAFWSDPDYVPMKELREANTDGDHILFHGL